MGWLSKSKGNKFGPITSKAKQMWPPAELNVIKQCWMVRQCGNPGWLGSADSMRLSTLYSAESPLTIATVPKTLRILTAAYLVGGPAVSLYKRNKSTPVRGRGTIYTYTQSHTLEVAHPS